MTSRFYTAAVACFWLLAMGWLTTTKILPALWRGTPPDYRDEFARETSRPPPPVGWDVYWNERPIGSTISQAFTHGGEPSEVRSVVQLRQVDVHEVMRELVGSMWLLIAPAIGDERLRVDLVFATRLRLDWEGELQGFETAVRLGQAPDAWFLRGKRTDDDRMQITFSGSGADDASAVPLSQEFRLPTHARYDDAFSPRSRMEGLFVGQRWTTPVVNPIGGGSSMRLVESLVEQRETITWLGEPVETFLVVYRYDAGSGSRSRKPVGRAWVRDDGVVLRQELPVGSAVVRMERTSDDRAIELGESLEGHQFDRHFRLGRE